MEIPVPTSQPVIVVEQAEVIAPAVEVQANANGEVMDVVNGEDAPVVAEQPAADAPIDIEVPHLQAQAQLQMPEMYHMDLELMHTELYKSKYLTPDDFLDDVRKIVHNAFVFSHEDADRLYRAQAMLTAAEVSIQDFDYQFRMDCQRMAARERKRRDEIRREKEKEKEREREKLRAAEAESARNSAEAPARRSTRANGLEPDFRITDPVQLERSLKRQRSADANADPSEEEGPAKRSRVSSQEVEHSNGNGVAGPSTPHRPPHAVRFADDPDGDGDVDMPSSPSPNNGQPVSPLPLPRIETPRGPMGFDSLLNPKRSPEEPRAADNALNQLTNMVNDQTPPDQAMIFETNQTNQQPNSREPSVSLLQPEALPSEVPNGVPQHPEQPPPNGDADDVVMLPDRTPTPPPAFELDETVVSDLASDLRVKTDRLNVEQLEQLRATCLNRIWKHRSEWDRTPLVKELREVVEGFIQDVSEYGLDNEDDS